ncbi:hypothetical protein [Alkalihalophilus marmarensis]|uniref:hypothetical protein n=1 Tax=Alkalihalophilus marmarensis TaxID=521377 RepID=UPI002DBA0B67|nr:hypothetical protein [Alkalihalophilus marmarensis]MEC2074241.1 hypothetical protein [Alkalihalophilus marmarensis]
MTAQDAIDVKDAAVVIEPIKTKADTLVKTAKYVSLLTYKDEVAPTIASVEAKTNSTRATSLTVKASEPIKAGVAQVKINGSYASVDFNNTDTATINGLSLLVGETHSIELINLEDLAGNRTVSSTANFTVSVDSVAPTSTLTAKGDNQILVTFSKPMNPTTVTAALVDGSVKNEALAPVGTGVPSVVADTNNTQFLIPVTDTLYSDKDTRTLNVVLPNTIEDSLGNKLEASTQTVTLRKDTVKPVATGYNVVKNSNGEVTAIEVNFSEGLEAVAAGMLHHRQ